MTAEIQIAPIAEPVDFSIRPPGSKSLSNRALICAAMADGQSRLTGLLDSEDTQVMFRALRQLGIEMTGDLQSEHLMVRGCNGRIPISQAEIHVAGSGTTMRFLTAVLAIAGGKYRLDGIPRMRQRPMGPLLQALRGLGAGVSGNRNECPPITIDSRPSTGGRVTVTADASSQFVSGLLLAAPLAQGTIEIEVVGDLVSAPYVQMTCQVMNVFGVHVETNGEAKRWRIPARSHYQAADWQIEPDASAASYFMAIPALVGGSATILGLGRDSLQGDVRFAEALTRMGCDVAWRDDSIVVSNRAVRGIDIDMSEFSDTAQTLAVVALFVQGPTRIRGVAHNRLKETDRIGHLANELRKLGATVIEHADGLEIHPPSKFRGATIETYNDHRMAMSLALAGLKIPGVVIRDPACVEKTYPRFFEDLQRIIAKSQATQR